MLILFIIPLHFTNIITTMQAGEYDSIAELKNADRLPVSLSLLFF